jgi:NAD+ synthase (glutamine-hydrolysing)
MNVILAQLNYHVGNFEQNINKMKLAIAEAEQQKADLIVFAELSFCGYPPRDFLTYNQFAQKCEEAVLTLANYTQKVAVILGSPQINAAKNCKNL